MKAFLTLAILVTLVLPSAAQVITPGQASGLRQKGIQLSPAAASRINFDKGMLLHQGLGLTRNPATALGFKGVPPAVTALGQKGFMRADAGNRAWGKGLNQYTRPVLRDGCGFRAGSLLVGSRSQYFRGDGRKSAFTNSGPHIPGVDSHIRETLTYHFAWLGGATGLQVKDPIAKDSWSLRMACRPRVKKESDNRYTAQVACYGRLGWSQQQLPVVVQFTLLGSDKKWKVHGQPVIVSANRIVRPGHNVMANLWAEESIPSAVDSAIHGVTE